MRTRRTARGLAALALVAPLSAAGVLLTAGSAAAASGITAPGDGVTYTSDATVHIAATVDKNTGSAQLRMKSPADGSSAQTVATASTSLTSGASLSYDFDTATCATFPGSCSGRAEAPNGVWTVQLVSGGSVVDTSTFTLRIAPRAPRSVAARADGYRAVVLTWAKGDEPDLAGWTVYADGSPGQDVGTDACSSSGCSTTVTYAEEGTGEHTYSLVAHRFAAPGSSDTLDSPQSSQVSATLDSPPPPPPPSPAATGGTGGDSTGDSTTGDSTTGDGTGTSSTGGSTSSGGGSSSTGGTSGGTSTGGTTGKTTASGAGKAPVTVAQRRAFALTFKAFAPKLGIPKLPPLPAAQGPSVAPLPDGTYEKTLGYGSKDVVTTEKVSAPQAAARRVTGVVGSALDSDQFLRFMAGALILMLAAAHLRRWLGTHDND